MYQVGKYLHSTFVNWGSVHSTHGSLRDQSIRNNSHIHYTIWNLRALLGTVLYILCSIKQGCEIDQIADVPSNSEPSANLSKGVESQEHGILGSF